MDTERNKETKLVTYAVYLPYDSAANVYPCRVQEDGIVHDLVRRIREEPDLKAHLGDGAPSLFKCEDFTMKNLNLTNVYDEALERVRGRPENEKMVFTFPLTHYFPKGPARQEDQKIDVIAVTDPILGKQRASSPPPALYDAYSRRSVAVSGLWEKVMKYRFIWARGTPASGKSVLSRLLQARALQVLPSATVRRLIGWDDKCRRLWKTSLEERSVNTDPAVWIIDEAHLAYDDLYLWDFFKNIESYPKVYVICFVAYGSARDSLDVPGITPVYVEEKQRITLRPVDHKDGTPAVGLLFTMEEYVDMVQRRYADAGGHRFDVSFLDNLFEISGGHIGAIISILAVVESHDSYRLLIGSSERFSWDTFDKYFPPAKLAKAIATSFTIFRRGLPDDKDLQSADFRDALSIVAQRNIVMNDEVEPQDEEKLEKCLRRGWLHGDTIVKTEDATTKTRVAYFYASPLHRWFVQWKLYMDIDNSASAKPEGVLIDFVLNVIGSFDTRALSEERTIGPGAIQRTPEAQYQDEFYRCCHALYDGSVISFSEFGTKGRVDFYVKSTQWAIELLRDGDQIIEHVERFAPSGAYGGYDIREYVVLDCRTSIPRKARPHLQNLYHVVFLNKYTTVRVLDNNLNNFAEFGLVNRSG